MLGCTRSAVHSPGLFFRSPAANIPTAGPPRPPASTEMRFLKALEADAGLTFHPGLIPNCSVFFSKKSHLPSPGDRLHALAPSPPPGQQFLPSRRSPLVGGPSEPQQTLGDPEGIKAGPPPRALPGLHLLWGCMVGRGARLSATPAQGKSSSGQVGLASVPGALALRKWDTQGQL